MKGDEIRRINRNFTFLSCISNDFPQQANWLATAGFSRYQALLGSVCARSSASSSPSRAWRACITKRSLVTRKTMAGEVAQCVGWIERNERKRVAIVEWWVHRPGFRSASSGLRARMRPSLVCQVCNMTAVCT